jgi:tRNA(Ile)-lysidine synthase
MAGESRLSPAAQDLSARVADLLPDGPIIVALSGGADSAALAWAVVRSGRPVRAVSIDHGLDGSADLMRAATDIAAVLGLEHLVVPVAQASSSETDLRAARLHALESACGADEVIATGHTRDDQAETVLGNVLRGSGTAGLGGIPRRRGPFIRPMLDISRHTARTVAGEIGLPFRDDPQNDDQSIRRNRLRSRLIPELAADFNPGIVDALVRLASAAGDDDDLLERRAATIPILERDGAVLVPTASLRTLPPAVASRVVRRALRMVGDAYPGEASDVYAVLAACRGERSTMTGGIDVMREGPWVALIYSSPPLPEPVDIRHGERETWGGWWLEASDVQPTVGRSCAVLPNAVLTIRAPRSDDRIDIVGGTKSVGDALAEAGVPGRIRHRWPVVEADGTIVWIPGVRVAPMAGDGERMTVRAMRRRQ